MQFSGLFWFILTLLPLVILQRFLHREIRSVLLLLTRNPQLTMGLISVLFFPGVFLHELSHFVMARILRVDTKDISLVPHTLPDGRLQMGYVETDHSDIFRDSLIGLAPLIAGTLFVAYAGIYQLRLLTLWEVFRHGQFDLFWMGVILLPRVNDFYLWLYLTFTVSGTMLPSDSDRGAWLPLGLWVVVLLALAILGGAGNWMLANLAPLLDHLLNSVALLFGLSAMVCAALTIPFFTVHRVLAYVMEVDAA